MNENGAAIKFILVLYQFFTETLFKPSDILQLDIDFSLLSIKSATSSFTIQETENILPVSMEVTSVPFFFLFEGEIGVILYTLCHIKLI